MTTNEMALAIEAGRRGHGRTAPNPPVGAVLFRDGVVIGSGHTQPVGFAHAEVDALRDCVRRGNDPKGATMYVTLEPCNTHGRTPPCTDALIEAGVSKVVIGWIDPTDPMQGRSVHLLEQAGIEVEVMACPEARSSVLGWVRSIDHGLPEVTLKAASTADGAVATAEGHSQWITGPDARADGRGLRGTHDAIVVGSGTVLADNPRLTTRIEGAPDPVAVVLDTRGRFPVGCALDRPGTLVYVGPGVTMSCEATVVPVVLDGDRVSLEHVLRDLVARDLHRILVEGGPTVIGAFLAGGWADRVVQYLAGKLAPGGRGWVGIPPTGRLEDAPVLRLSDVRRVGADVRIDWVAPHRLEMACSPD